MIDIDWTASMTQTYEFYTVVPSTWQDDEKLDCITSCTINRDSSNATLGHATLECTSELPECYVRVYLIVGQNGMTWKLPLGTYLVQTPSDRFNGMYHTLSMDAYSPLLELKDVPPPLGYTVFKNENIMDKAFELFQEHMRAPVVRAKSDVKLFSDFVANLDDSWLTFLTDFIANAKFELDLDELGRVLFPPKQDIASLQHVWQYNDDNSSILFPDIEDERDLYGIPNVAEVVYSSDAGSKTARAVNDDVNSPISTVNRGREIVYRDTNPSFSGEPTQEEIDDYAVKLLRNLSCLEHTVTYTHGYCPVRVGDCVLLNYKRAGLSYVKAKVTSQSIKCTTGCPVEETAVYTTKLWG